MTPEDQKHDEIYCLVCDKMIKEGALCDECFDDQMEYALEQGLI